MDDSFHIHLSSRPLHELKGLKMTPWQYTHFCILPLPFISVLECERGGEWGLILCPDAQWNFTTGIFIMVCHHAVTPSDTSSHSTPPSGWENSSHILSHFEERPQHFFFFLHCILGWLTEDVFISILQLRHPEFVYLKSECKSLCALTETQAPSLSVGLRVFTLVLPWDFFFGILIW